MTIEIKPFGDTGIRIGFAEEISIDVNKQIRSLIERLKMESIPAIQEWIPSYTALTVIYDPCICRYETLSAEIENLTDSLAATEVPPAKRVRLPVYYGGETGPDLAYVAEINGISAEEVIRIHSSADYFIYMIGFTPGFPYLGGMSKTIAASRRATPRKIVPSGTVGIAGEQTGVYSMITPGGWQLIGHTPVPLYNPTSDPPVLLEAGDYLQFDPISLEEYNDIAEKVKQETYQLTVEPFNNRDKGGLNHEDSD